MTVAETQEAVRRGGTPTTRALVDLLAGRSRFSGAADVARTLAGRPTDRPFVREVRTAPTGTSAAGRTR